MIIYHDVIGSKETSLHTFDIAASGNELLITDGEYLLAGQVAYSGPSQIILVESSGDYEVWLTKTGFQLIHQGDLIEQPIDRLAWFSQPEGLLPLEETQIHFMRIVQ